MGNGADVWLDANQLKPGDTIQLRIYEAFATHDVMILVWSAAAVQSKGVAAEIDTANADHNAAIVIRKRAIDQILHSGTELVGASKNVLHPRSNANP
jgi:hypothetical protein